MNRRRFTSRLACAGRTSARLWAVVWLSAGLHAVAVAATEPAALQTAESTAPGPHEFSIRVGDLMRRYVVYVPKSYDGTKAVSVVLMYHGGGGNARHSMKQTKLPEKAEQAGFLAVFPEGTSPDPSKRPSFKNNPQTWNDGSGRFHAGKKNIDDVGFTSELLDDLSSRFNVDKRRVFATGHSNGSSMVYRLGAELAHRIAAIAPVASSGLKVKDPKPSRPVPMITIQGASDPRNPLEGGEVDIFGTKQIRPSPRDSVKTWAQVSGCPADPAVMRKDADIEAVRFAPCRDGAEIVFYVVSGLGHQWAGGTPSTLAANQHDVGVGPYSDKISATDVIWGFFEKHALPVTPATE